MRRTCAGVAVQFDGSVCVRKKDIEKVYKEKTGKNFNIKLNGKAWSEEYQAYFYPVYDNHEVFYDLHDLMMELSFDGDITFNRWFFDAFMREVFFQFEAASRIRFARQIVSIAKEEE